MSVWVARCAGALSRVASTAWRMKMTRGHTHFYRLIRIARDDFSAFAKYYHYFGTNFRIADTATPNLRPPQYLFRKKKRT